MKAEEVIALAVRIFAIALAIYSIRELSAVIWVIERDEFAAGAKVAVYIIGTVTLVISVLLWKFPLTVASHLYTPSDKDNREPRWGATDLYYCGFILIGIVFLLRALSDGLYWALYIFWLADEASDIYRIDADQKAAMAATIIEFLFGVLLILGHQGITKLVYFIRFGGVKI